MSSNETATTGNAGGGGAGGASDPTGPSPDEVIVFWLDIGLLCVVGAFFLALLPRAIGRFSNLTEWTRGLLLRSGPPPNPMIQRITPNDRLYRPDTRRSSFGDGASDQSHTLADHNAYIRSGKEWASMPSGRGDVVYPTHVRSLATILHPVSKIFTHPLSANKTTGKLFLTLAYVVTIHVIVLDGDNPFLNPIVNPNRLGYIAISQIPVVIALGTKNNVIGMLLGIGYEKLNFLHRLVGLVVFITANVHATVYIISFVSTQNFEALQAPFIQAGQAGLIGVTLLFLAASGGIRTNAYTVFLILHIVGTVIFFVGIWYHQAVCSKYVLLAVGIYGFDHLFRIVKTRFATARLTAVPELGLTHVEVPSVGAGWRAGQHVRLRVLSGSMGWFGWTTAHPFTIASAAESDKGMVLMCKKAGGWTRKLYTAASQSGTGGIENGYNMQSTREMKVIVEGPYGGTGHVVMSSYSSVLLVAGGSGITFGLGAAEELIQDILNGRSSVKFIELVWSTQERGSLAPMIPSFSTLFGLVANVPGVVLRITVHYTRAEKPDTDGGKARAAVDAHLATLAPNLSLQPGRPPLQRIANSIARLTASVPDARGLAVGVCGPAGLALETAKAVKAVDSTLRNSCGGVELHEE
ncbi:hypothetical protein A7U60_g5661 [Sanghuangporus baumii]|uniref:ferric-chelate reductase (NADPH) n=1 Tax=Sanghuangporus baumii TaxID=108892 RepID=A0A9Q5HW86_SANBA|nr:hypothetical protein A7U60_g5661 [Sanghuangporus baumii]